MEVLRIIAMLCNLSTGVVTVTGIKAISTVQAECHAYYSGCFDKKRATMVGNDARLLLECMKDKPK